MIQWWGYEHINGSFQVKRFFNDNKDLLEANESPFVKQISNVFYAKNREEALIILKQELKNGI